MRSQQDSDPLGGFLAVLAGLFLVHVGQQLISNGSRDLFG